ncbi:MAG: RhuM family protein [Alphaproteobacteria bacterium]|nr:MAG: hypothetical protein B6I23_00590 [Rickettsiaceae bacterium 4572_127]
MKKGSVQFYKTKNGDLQLDVKLQNETVWLSQGQMSKLFDKNKSTISRHINNVFREGELEENSVVAKYATTGTDGKSYQVEYYNLDVIISVGYRVKSQRGTQFRIWATSILKNHIKQGYSLYTRKLEQQGIDVNALIKLLEKAFNRKALQTSETSEILNIIQRYSSTFNVLFRYDKDELGNIKGSPPSIELKISDAKKAITSLKNELLKKGEATDLFGKERADIFTSIIGNIEQSFGGQLLYPTVENRASHLLYFIIKDHPFIDGNKRSASFMFILYLFQNGVVQHINEHGLVALTLLIAESHPSQKDIMIRLIQNLITKNKEC